MYRAILSTLVSYSDIKRLCSLSNYDTFIPHGTVFIINLKTISMLLIVSPRLVKLVKHKIHSKRIDNCF